MNDAKHFGSNKGNWADRPHSAGVGARLAFAHSFVVGGLGQEQVVLAVGKHKNRELGAGKVLLNDHAA